MGRAGLKLAVSAALGWTALSGTAALAEDSSVAERLNAAEIKFEVDSDGDYKIVYDYSKEQRTQLVFVSGKTETLGDLVIREVFAPTALLDKHNINVAKAIELLRNSAEVKLGAWELRGNVVYFVVKIFDDVTATELKTVMDIAAETADDMEIKLTDGADDL